MRWGEGLCVGPYDPLPIRINSVSALTGTHAGEFDVDVENAGGHPTSVFEGGILAGSSSSEIVDYSPGSDDGIFTLKSTMPVGITVEACDDDSPHVPRAVDWSLMNSKFKPAYIECFEEPAVSSMDLPWIRNFSGALDDLNTLYTTRSVTTSAEYWVTQIVAGHEGPEAKDGDPDFYYHVHSTTSWKFGDAQLDEGKTIIGGTIPQDYNLTVIMLETIRDIIEQNAEVQIHGLLPPFPPAQLNASQRESLTVVHEVGHVFGCDHNEDGIMHPSIINLGSIFTGKSLVRIRGLPWVEVP
jgi:hypothetical protein